MLTSLRKRYEKYADRFPSPFDLDPYLPIEFQSGCIRPPLSHRNENETIVRDNNEFPLFVRISPEIGLTSQRHLVIVINGFDEIPRMLRLHMFDDRSITSRLFDNSTPVPDQVGAPPQFSSVLLPIPFHHWRRPILGDYREMDSSTMIYYDPIRLFLGFRQLLHDIDELLDFVLDPERRHRAGLFQQVPIISIMGYSLGGLATLAAFLLDQMTSRNRIHACTLLASGLPLTAIDFTKTPTPDLHSCTVRRFYGTKFAGHASGHEQRVIDKISKGEILPQIGWKPSGHWRAEFQAQSAVYSSKELPHDGLLMDLFDHIVLGHSSDSSHIIETSWQDLSERVGYMLCEKDEVFLPHAVRDYVPAGVAFNQIATIPSCGHPLYRERPWLREDGEKAIRHMCDWLDALPRR